MTTKVIKDQLKAISENSGIYQFFSAKNELLYVGKAKNLRKRITSYTNENRLSKRISRLVFLTQKIETVQTESEVEALLLEHNLIKKFSPRFNILLRDDKTFPQILLTNHDFPQITKHRQVIKFSESRKINSVKSYKTFGPFASGGDVNRVIEVLRKTFRLRNCSDSEFSSRTRPCLEYQIKKCTAPCVGMISQKDYQSCVNSAVAFLGGKSSELQEKLSAKMAEYSANQDYENAAIIRDQINALNAIQAKQNINVSELRNSDVITLVSEQQMICVYVAFFRGGQNFGAKPYFYEIDALMTVSQDAAIGVTRKAGRATYSNRPFKADLPEIKSPSCALLPRETSKSEICETSLTQFLADFLGQFYLSQTPPSEIFLNLEIADHQAMEGFLTKIAEEKVTITVPVRGERLRIIKDQEVMALQNLQQKMSQNLSTREFHLQMKKIFDLNKIPQKIEIYDNSHTVGTNAVGALVTAGIEGFLKSGYRKFNIGKVVLDGKSDDTAMLREVFFRRFSKLKEADYPDLIIIDGGKGQARAVWEILTQLNVGIEFVAMAKGEDRNAGLERFFRVTKNGEIVEVAKDLDRKSPLMYYLQRLRDEAHRFAIMTHRKKRDKAMLSSGA